MWKALGADYLLFAASLARALVLPPLLALWLGAEGFGLWALALSLAGWLDFANFAVAGGAVRRIAEAAGRSEAGLEPPGSLRRAQASASLLFLGLGLLLALLAMPLAWLAPWFLPEGTPPADAVEARLVVLIASARIALGTALQVHQSILWARKRLQEVFAVQIAGVVAGLVGSLWVIALGGNLAWLALVQLLAFLPEAAWFWALARRRFPEGRWRIGRDASLSEARAMLGVGGWLAASSAAGLLQARAVPAILGASSGLRAVGVYDANGRLWQMGLLLLRKLPSALWPRLSESLGSGGGASARRHLKAMAVPTLALASAGCAGFGAFAREALSGWLGAAMWGGWALAACLGAMAFLKAAHHFLHVSLLGAGDTKAPAMATFAELPLALGLLAWMAPRWGAAGAAGAVLLANLATTMWFTAWKFCQAFGLPFGRTLAKALRLVLACALPSAGVALALKQGVEPGSLLGAAICGGLASVAGLAGGWLLGLGMRPGWRRALDSLRRD